MNKQIVFEQPTIITGPYRGGTSLVAGIFNLCGAWIGPSMPANRFNPKGYFENEGLKSLLHFMLQMSGYNDSDNLPPDELIKTRSPDRFRHVFESAIAASGYMGGQWAIKNPKIAFFWHYFDDAYPDAKWVVVRRPSEQVVASISRVNPFTVSPVKLPMTRDRLNAIVKGYQERLDSLVRNLPPDRVREVDSKKIVEGDLEQLRDVIAWTGLQFDEAAVSGFIEPSHYHSALSV